MSLIHLLGSSLVLSLFLVPGCSGGADVTATDAACGQSIDAVVGDTIAVSLGSTYWSFGPTSDSSVIVQDGTTEVTPTGGCVPGAGCGTARALFDAVGVGQATIDASRTSCGEAMGCGPDQGQGICTITVNVVQ
jgi:hypothetical protein